jgi:hypothetical protein
VQATPKPRGSWWIAGGLLLLALAPFYACALVSKPAVTAPPSGMDLPRRVAVLPFENRTSNPEAATVLRRMFFNFFSALNYVDIVPAVVDATLEASRISTTTGAGEASPMERLGQLLGVDAVVVGEVLALGQTYALVYANQQAGLRARMVRCSTGQVVWEMEHTVTLHEGDLPLSLTGLAAAIVKTAFNYHQSDTMRVASELCMQMTASMPNPPAESEIPPLIQALVHNGAAGLLSPGDELRVVMIGDKRHKASLSLPPLLLEAPMEEKEPGVYVASYRIQPQDRLAEGQLTGYLRSPSGSSRQWMDTLGPIRAGRPTALPAVIAADTVLAADQSPYLVEDVLVVMPGATLTIEPGVVVWFRSLGLVVRGTLHACGTAEHSVIFSSLKVKGWKGIFIEGSEGENHFQHCRISGAEFGIRSTRARLVVEDCRLQENTWAVVAEDGQVDIRGSLVRASAKTGIAMRNSRLAVNGSVITENAAGGFLLEGSTAVIEGNNIVNNGGWGIKTIGAAIEIHAGNNWWGKGDADLSEMVKGDVLTHPLLPAPIGAGFAVHPPY